MIRFLSRIRRGRTPGSTNDPSSSPTEALQPHQPLQSVTSTPPVEQTPLLPKKDSLELPSGGGITFADDVVVDRTPDMSSPSSTPSLTHPFSRTRVLFHSVSNMSSRIWNEHFGHIGVVGSTSIAVNFLTGPAMLELPSLYQKAGIIPTSVTILLVGTLSALGSLHLARVISQIPGNAHFEQPIEYSDVFYHYFLRSQSSQSTTDTTTITATTTTTPLSTTTNAPSTHNNHKVARLLVLATQVAFFACITSLNISSMVDAAQVMDSILANPQFVGQTVGLELQGRRHFLQLTFWNYRSCHQQEDLEGECIPFTAYYNPDLEKDDDTDAVGSLDGTGCILTLGYLLTLLCFLPLSLMDLQENAAWQVVEFIVLLITSVIFAVLFWNTGLNTDNVSWWGESWDGLLGVILFNFALVISISSWLYEKEPGVDARQVIIGSTTLAAFLYITLGILGALAIPQVSPNMLQSFLSGTFGPAMQYTASVFALFIVGLGIPLLCVLCRLNLRGGSSSSSSNGGSSMSERTANWLAVYLPFGISWMLYRGDSVTQLLSWGGTICTSLIAFVFPWLVALQALTTVDPLSYTLPGTIDVYGSSWRSKVCGGSVGDGPGKRVDGRNVERTALRTLLCLSLVCIASAIVGNLLRYDD